MTTVVITSYRYGHLVSHAIESVLSQTQKPDRILVVDDGWGDCWTVPLAYPEIGFLARPANLGIVANFNDILFKRIKGERVMFLGADNWLHPNALEELGECPEDIITYLPYLVGGWDLDQETNLEWLDGYPVRQTNGAFHGSVLYNIDLARKAGGYKASGNEKSEEDNVLFSRMVVEGATTRFVPAPYLYYRKHRRNFQP